MKLLDQLQNKLETLKTECQELLNQGKVEEAKAKMQEINATKDAIDVQKVLDQEEDEEMDNKMPKDKKRKRRRKCFKGNH